MPLPTKGSRVRVTGLPGPDPHSGFVDPCPMEVGATGTVRSTPNERTNQIWVIWDNGRSLFLLTTDPYEVIGEGWPVVTCEKEWGCECPDPIAYPPEDTRVEVSGPHETRAVGDDSATPVVVPHGATGIVRGFVEEWHHVHVELDDGQQVWIDPEILNPTKETA